ncbi:MAG: hypothetical protein OEM25_04400 [Gammaproteobacteria bacterium]|nr:hypothetical protein [Gammaproteobacteria bacterium]
MVIELNGRTKLTTEFERLFVELGGADPSKTLTRDELREALVKAIEALPADSRILRKMYDYYRSEGLLDESIEKYGEPK